MNNKKDAMPKWLKIVIAIFLVVWLGLRILELLNKYFGFHIPIP